jgi:hypothetical protein
VTVEPVDPAEVNALIRDAWATKPALVINPCHAPKGEFPMRIVPSAWVEPGVAYIVRPPDIHDFEELQLAGDEQEAAAVARRHIARRVTRVDNLGEAA